MGVETMDNKLIEIVDRDSTGNLFFIYESC
jgi:hypothetical protein